MPFVRLTRPCKCFWRALKLRLLSLGPNSLIGVVTQMVREFWQALKLRLLSGEPVMYEKISIENITRKRTGIEYGETIKLMFLKKQMQKIGRNGKNTKAGIFHSRLEVILCFSHLCTRGCKVCGSSLLSPNDPHHRQASNCAEIATLDPLTRNSFSFRMKNPAAQY